MPRPCFHCDGSGYVDAETGDSCAEDDENAVECENCNGTGEYEPTDEEVAEAEGDQLFHMKRDEGEI